MDPTTYINERVEVVAVFRKAGDLASLCMPAKVYFRGREIIMVELGLRHPTVAGKRMIHVFDLTDGSNDYRLEFDAEALIWTLVAILEGRHVRR